MLNTIKMLPDAPGIYQFFDANSKLLYVGKAKSLKNRVKSYFRFSPSLMPTPNMSVRIVKMIGEAHELNYIVVNSESDALILENSLIKQLKPKYNILLRDDKTYPYIFIDDSADFPRLDITRRVIAKKGTKIRYFGPITAGARELLGAIYENFKLVQKASCLKGKKACLFYQLEMCMAPCQFDVDRDEYAKLVNNAIECIAEPTKLLPKLTEKMHRLAEELRFEEAGATKAQIESIKKIIPQSSVDLAGGANFDLIAISEGESEACIVRFFIRHGKLISSANSFVRYSDNDKELYDANETYTQAIFDFYSEESPNETKELVVPVELLDAKWLESAIKTATNKTLKIVKATGEKAILCDLAIRNGYELLKNKKKEDRALYFELKSFFELDRVPVRIEVFDNSHMAKQASVAGMIVWDGGFDKSSYRKYNLESLSEYAQMKEVLSRRALDFQDNPPPDMWLIDGGKANYDLAKEIVASSGASVDVLAIAKEKRDAKSVRSKSKADDKIVCSRGVVRLPSHDPKLLFLQRLRDEAHRFAIEFHRKQKLKDDKTIKMLEIKGIKEGKLKKLLSFFGSFENISKASMEQLEMVLSSSDAKKLVDFFGTSND